MPDEAARSRVGARFPSSARSRLRARWSRTRNATPETSIATAASALVRPSQGDAQGMRGALPHGASKRVVQIAGTDVEPFLRRLVDGHDNFIRPVTS